MKIKFIDVGRDKKSWEAEINSLSYITLKKQIIENKALASKFPDFDLIDDNNGVITAGGRLVGRFNIVAS